MKRVINIKAKKKCAKIEANANEFYEYKGDTTDNGHEQKVNSIKIKGENVEVGVEVEEIKEIKEINDGKEKIKSSAVTTGTLCENVLEENLKMKLTKMDVSDRVEYDDSYSGGHNCSNSSSIKCSLNLHANRSNDDDQNEYTNAERGEEKAPNGTNSNIKKLDNIRIENNISNQSYLVNEEDNVYCYNEVKSEDGNHKRFKGECIKRKIEEMKKEMKEGTKESVKTEVTYNSSYCDNDFSSITNLNDVEKEFAGLVVKNKKHNKNIYEKSKSINNLNEKWKLLPAYLKVKGLVKQHIESYNYFIKREIKTIMNATTNKIIKSDIDEHFYVEFLDISVGRPSVEENMIETKLTPQICRQRDLTYSAPIYVDVEYVKGNSIVTKSNVEIGRLPVMLRSDICVLNNKNEEELMKLGECPYDPGGYFIVKGTERVLLMQEQLSKNRIIVEMDIKHNICATITSTTAESKSRCAIVYKNSKLYLKHNSFIEDIGVCIILKAMGYETDQEIFQMIGSHRNYMNGILLSLYELYTENIKTNLDALLYIGKKIRPRLLAKGFFSSMKEKQVKNEKDIIEEGLDFLSRVLLSHIQQKSKYDFRNKARCICLMIRRVLDSANNQNELDDKDYYGNKRLELAGQLISLLFEDLYKRFYFTLKKQIDQTLSKYMQSSYNSKMRNNNASGYINSSGSSNINNNNNSSSYSSNLNDNYPDVFRNLPKDIITRGMQTAISTGNWNIKRFKMEKSGVSQVLSRLSFIACIGMMTRLNSQFEKGRKVSGPRALQPSQWGVLCPCDTPEGESCGLVKNLALMTHVTNDNENNKNLIEILYTLGVEDSDSLTGEEIYKEGVFFVILNGILLGVHKRPQRFMQRIRYLRRYGKIGEFVSIYDNFLHNAIYISTDGGRLCRPLIIVENGKCKLLPDHIKALENGKINFFDLLKSSVIEWIDVNEQNNLLIALNEEDISSSTTHLEIDPLTILGVVAGLIPYPNHNQSPRNTYQCAMGKQAIGAIGYNQFVRYDTLLYLLVYPQKPLVKSKTIEFINFEKLPAGQNAIVAVMSFCGYDIEDAIVLNRSSIDRGFGRCMSMRKHSVELKKYFNGSNDIVLPSPLIINKIQKEKQHQQQYQSQHQSQLQPIQGSEEGTKLTKMNNNLLRVKNNTNAQILADIRREEESTRIAYKDMKKYHSLDIDGVASIGYMLKEGQVYVNKYSPKNIKDHVKDTSKIDINDFKLNEIKYKSVYPSYIDKIIFTENSEGLKIYKIIMRQTRLPELGDKFSSRHGQKGVVGLLVNQEDMPFTESGICPDLIMNPHGFPSRMTVGKLLELVASKSAVMDGEFKYGSIFSGTPFEEIAKILFRYGFNCSSKELLYSGLTGEPLETYIFMGPIYYQKLKHMVQDKIHARARGPRQLLTRQPTEGRSKEGGLRLGEMERDCLIAYGVSNLLLERLMLSSDVCDVYICEDCGIMGYDLFCTFCKKYDKNVVVKMPYACKLLFQELQTMNVFPKIIVKES
ncbi:DNA-directed RNA polymerase III subunit RPC2, putative [Plasmodium malariae]|uniref:DNA-directed RNA polymerase subunit beta n=1 Tax=Plasmodium malariae TaxID=5858 RepID=A0A1D3TCH6_PLAMA|nr:DNA-directed RNA polymerase III subunit RPC2, putative [Plasmodium malariae]SCP02519.1 DNA-directed RNA polymerase III subunit RPC2, putative [Plasmodium malariae]